MTTPRMLELLEGLKCLFRASTYFRIVSKCFSSEWQSSVIPLNFLNALFTFVKLLKKSCSKVYSVTISMPSWARSWAAYGCVDRLLIFLKLKFSVISSLKPIRLTAKFSYLPVPESLPPAAAVFFCISFRFMLPSAFKRFYKSMWVLLELNI